MKEPLAYEWLRPARGTDEIPRGAVVRDVATGRVGVLQDVTYFAETGGPPGERRPRLLAFLRPVGGGREWTTAPDMLRAEPD